jgi:uncharacterized protein (DUF924 family)
MSIALHVREFWFGPMGSPDYQRPKPFWFTRSAQTDEMIRTAFGGVVDAALRGEHDGWAADRFSRVALILVLDQFTRNIYRDTPRSFAGDARALALARDAVRLGEDQQLPLIERWFVYLPFEHSEALADQRESMRLFTALADAGLSEPLEWARKHFEVIARFGRFPHRNAILGRESTPEEFGFLRQPGSRF